ncbi:hypothetical protein SAMN02910358_02488 [Lachnospiraceae bacterium XBB1006]|nr:hypothetical protein SAMN02910358_02488 [Lachnospiraceae bacterium XBB1006]
MKKVCSFILATACVLSLLPTMPARAEVTKQEIVANTTYDNLHGEHWDDEYQFSFTAPEKGYFEIKITNTVAGDNDQAKIVVFDENNKEMYSHSDITYTTVKFPTTTGMRYLLKLNNVDGSTYSLRVNFTVATNWESGKNVDTASATNLTTGKEVYGILDRANEEDYYKFRVDKLSKVTLTLGPAEVTGDNKYFDGEIINSQNQTTSPFDYSSATQKKTVYLKKGTYYLKIHGDSAMPYRLQVSAKSANLKRVKIAKVGVSARQHGFFYDYRTVKNIKIKNYGAVDGYTVQVSTKKGFGNREYDNERDLGTYSDSDTKSTIRRMNGQSFRIRKAYYFRVRPYVYDAFGVKVYAKYSPIVKKKF